MALEACALVTLAELKTAFPLSGTSRDSQLESAIGRASREIEAYLGRRIVYRAPTASAAAIVAANTVIGAGSLTLAGQPSTPSTLVVAVTDADRSVTAATLTVTGTVAGVAGTTEVYNLAGVAPTVSANGTAVYYGTKFFSAISSVVLSGVTGATAADLIQVGISSGYLDYYSPERGPELWLADYPVRQLYNVNEDATRAYATSTDLVAGTDFEVDNNQGQLRRVSRSTLPYWPMAPWPIGYRSVRVIYSAGYFTAANVPSDIKGVCLRLAKLYYDVEQRGQLGLSGSSDQTGNWTRFATAGLNDSDLNILRNHRATPWGTQCERAFDLEAA